MSEKGLHPLISQFLKSRNIKNTEEYLNLTEKLKEVTCLSTGITQLFSESKFETKETDFMKDGFLILHNVTKYFKDLEYGAKFIKFLSKSIDKNVMSFSKEDLIKNYENLTKITYQNIEVSYIILF